MKPPDDENTSNYLENKALALLLAGVSIAFVAILLPFYGTVLWGAIIALLFKPLYRRLLAVLKGRRTLAAVLTLAVVIVIVIVPMVFFTASLARQAALVYGLFESGQWSPVRYFHTLYDALPEWLGAVLDDAGFDRFETLQQRLGEALAQGSQLLAKRAVLLGQNTFEFVAQLFITLYLAFFLIRDGDAVAHSLQRALPMAPQHKADLIGKFTTVVRATVKGNLLVAATQGFLGGIAFWALGVNAALLWAVLMAFLSLLPAVGAALVWVPVAIWFVMTGALWKGIVLTLWGVLVIGLVDNLLRPVLVGKDTRMPDYLVLISTLGGMAVFGLNGFVIGPAIAAMFIAVWQIHVVTRSDAQP